MSYCRISNNIFKVKKKKINTDSKSTKLWYIYVNEIKVGEIQGSYTWVKRKPTDRILTKQQWLYRNIWHYDSLSKLFNSKFTIGKNRSDDFIEFSKYRSPSSIFDSMYSDLIAFHNKE